MLQGVDIDASIYLSCQHIHQLPSTANKQCQPTLEHCQLKLYTIRQSKSTLETLYQPKLETSYQPKLETSYQTKLQLLSTMSNLYQRFQPQAKKNREFSLTLYQPNYR